MAKLKFYVIAAAGLALVAPVAFATLSGSGQVTDIVQLSTTTPSLDALSSAGTPIASTSAFTMTNSGSNVDTFLRYDWGTTPYVGASSASTTISVRLATHYISDLLWFKQQTVSAAGTETTSEVFSPLLIKNSAGVASVTWTSLGNACTSWTGTPATGFIKAAAGSFTVKYHLAASPSDNTPSTATFHYCLDTTSNQVYLAKTTSFDAASTTSLLYLYSTASAGGVLNTYRYQLLPGSTTTGNHYCLVGVTGGTGTSATPDLAQCQMLPYENAASTTAKLFVLMDTPLYFPATNQGGTITYGVAGTQWNPYTPGTTNPAE